MKKISSNYIIFLISNIVVFFIVLVYQDNILEFFENSLLRGWQTVAALRNHVDQDLSSLHNSPKSSISMKNQIGSIKSSITSRNGDENKFYAQNESADSVFGYVKRKVNSIDEALPTFTLIPTKNIENKKVVEAQSNNKDNKSVHQVDKKIYQEEQTNQEILLNEILGNNKNIDFKNSLDSREHVSPLKTAELSDNSSQKQIDEKNLNEEGIKKDNLNMEGRAIAPRKMGTLDQILFNGKIIEPQENSEVGKENQITNSFKINSEEVVKLDEKYNIQKYFKGAMIVDPFISKEFGDTETNSFNASVDCYNGTVKGELSRYNGGDTVLKIITQNASENYLLQKRSGVNKELSINHYAASGQYSCFLNLYCRTINNLPYVISREDLGCAAHSHVSRLHMVDIKNKRHKTINLLQAISLGLENDLIIERYPGVFEQLFSSNKNFIEIRFPNGGEDPPLVLSLPDQPNSFFSGKKHEIIFAMNGLIERTTGSFNGNNYIGVWKTNQDNADQWNVVIKTTSRSVDGDNIGGSGYIKFGDGRFLPVIWKINKS